LATVQLDRILTEQDNPEDASRRMNPLGVVGESEIHPGGDELSAEGPPHESDLFADDLVALVA